MRVIQGRNVCELWPRGHRLLHSYGVKQSSRAGEVLVMDDPVTTIYDRPRERVLFCPVRDANPMFHLMESLWMLAGRNDAPWLDTYVKDFSSRFGERLDNGASWGAYGARWRNWFMSVKDKRAGEFDQLSEIVYRLKTDPGDRRVVLTMWDPEADLDPAMSGMKDYPCNTHAYFRIVQGSLDMTVCCRSNDIVWGCYGANAVHFSVLQEYLAARLGVPVGLYRQISNNYHAYINTLPNAHIAEARGESNPYWTMSPRPLVDNPDSFDDEVMGFCETREPSSRGWVYKNRFIPDVAFPVHMAAVYWRDKNKDAAMKWAAAIQAPDWKRAVMEWMWRRGGVDGNQRSSETKPKDDESGTAVSHLANVEERDGW